MSDSSSHTTDSPQYAVGAMVDDMLATLGSEGGLGIGGGSFLNQGTAGNMGMEASQEADSIMGGEGDINNNLNNAFFGTQDYLQGQDSSQTPVAQWKTRQKQGLKRHAAAASAAATASAAAAAVIQGVALGDSTNDYVGDRKVHLEEGVGGMHNGKLPASPFVSSSTSSSPSAATSPLSSVVLCENSGILKLLQYNEYQRRRPSDNNYEFWRNFVSHFFAHNASIKLEMTANSAGESRIFEPGIEILPRVFKTKYDCGIKVELLQLDNPREQLLPQQQGCVVDCQSAAQVSCYDEAQVWAYGSLRVVFNAAMKITHFYFCSRAHEEKLPRYVVEAAVSKGAVPQSPVNEMGISPAFARLLFVEEVVRNLKFPMLCCAYYRQGPLEAIKSYQAQLKASQAVE